MGLNEQQNVLALIFTDPNYRRSFLADPERTGLDAGLDSDEARDIAAIPPEELSFFSDSLIWKRSREVEKMLPLVSSLLQDDFDRTFRAFSASFNPKLVKKHLEDAAAFCTFLELDPDISGPVKSAAKFERTRLDFFAHNRRLAFCFLDYDLRKPLPEPGQEHAKIRKRRSISLWLRLGRRVHHFMR